MSLLKTLTEPCPLATVAFVKWLNARNTLKPYLPFLRRPFDELPDEMVYGVVLMFFQDHGILVNGKITSKGRQRTMVYTKRMVGGTFRIIHKGRIKASVADSMGYSMVAGFKAIENKLQSAMPLKVTEEQTTVVIGLDIDEIMSRAKQKQAACLS